MMTPSTQEAERSLLGSILLDNRHYREATEHLQPEDFSLDSHRRIYSRMVDLAESSRPIDITTLIEELDTHKELETVRGEGYVSGLVDGVPDRPSLKHYALIVKEKALRRRLSRQVELVQKGLNGAGELQEIGQDLESLLQCFKDHQAGGDWRAAFHTREEAENAPPLTFAIEGFLQEQGITLIGGLAGHGKTLCMLAMARALLEGGKVFGKFPVTRTSKRVVYLIPEAGLGPFTPRRRTFRLVDYIGDRFFFQTLSAKQQLALTDPKLLAASEGADVFLDTAVRFMQGDENDPSEQRQFAESLFNLQRAGALTIVGAHHSPKSFAKDSYMSLENVLRGTGDIGAMLVTAWGLRQIDATTNQIFIQNVIPRDFQPCEPFIIQGRPSLDQPGYFEMPFLQASPAVWQTTLRKRAGVQSLRIKSTRLPRFSA